MEIFVVLSRDKSDFIFCTMDAGRANIEKIKQEIEEEMSGGRPSVYIVITTLH